ncbi:MAG: 3-oxo-tetronate kinase [Pseudomonadota bacterium]
MKLGCIGDDFTGSSDLANTLAKAGMRTIQYVGVPRDNAEPDIDAGVVALKSRSIAPSAAIRQSLAALDWLKRQGCSQFVFKYCSTFDSTIGGNIGPVAEALADALNAQKVIVCPAFPGTGRSVYQGHLFVNDRLLNESGMQNHPLTPMSDPDLRRWLGHQTTGSIGHVSAQDVQSGPEAIQQALNREAAAGHRLIIVDAISDAQLLDIGRAAKELRLITGGSGIALGLPGNFGIGPGSYSWCGQPRPALALSGSCSSTTRAQVSHHAKSHPVRELLAQDVIEDRVDAKGLIDWAMDQSGVPLISSSADPNGVAVAQIRFGVAHTSERLEAFFAQMARHARNAGVGRIVTAGGETSGAVVEGLNLARLEIGPEIDPGVPALAAGPELNIALKSGNFGSEDFFAKAADILANDRA